MQCSWALLSGIAFEFHERLSLIPGITLMVPAVTERGVGLPAGQSASLQAGVGVIFCNDRSAQPRARNLPASVGLKLEPTPVVPPATARRHEPTVGLATACNGLT